MYTTITYFLAPRDGEGRKAGIFKQELFGNCSSQLPHLIEELPQ